jgi:peptidyl-tRNA hydrolase
MHKVVLEVPTEADLLKTAEKLKENDISHKLWIEQPENYATCLAVKPYQKDQVQKFFKKYKLYKGPEMVKS